MLSLIRSLGGRLAEEARVALYRAASIGRATEPRLAGSRGSRPWRATIAAARKEDLGWNLAEDRHGLLQALHGARPGQGQALRAAAEEAAGLDSACAPCGRRTHGRDGKVRSRPNKKMNMASADRSWSYLLRQSSWRGGIGLDFFTPQ